MQLYADIQNEVSIEKNELTNRNQAKDGALLICLNKAKCNQLHYRNMI